MGPFFKHVQFLWTASIASVVSPAPALFSIMSKLAEGTLDPAVYVVDKGVEGHWSQDRSLEIPLMTGLHRDSSTFQMTPGQMSAWSVVVHFHWQHVFLP